MRTGLAPSRGPGAHAVVLKPIQPRDGSKFCEIGTLKYSHDQSTLQLFCSHIKAIDQPAVPAAHSGEIGVVKRYQPVPAPVPQARRYALHRAAARPGRHQRVCRRAGVRRRPLRAIPGAGLVPSGQHRARPGRAAARPSSGGWARLAGTPAPGSPASCPAGPAPRRG